jgi:hypothetical protein
MKHASCWTLLRVGAPPVMTSATRPRGTKAGSAVRVRAALLAALIGAACGCAGPSNPPTDGPAGLTLEDVDAAARALAVKIDEQAARGWPASVALEGTPPRPAAGVTLQNRCRSALDEAAFVDRIARGLGGHLTIHQPASRTGLTVTCVVTEGTVPPGDDGPGTTTYTLALSLVEADGHRLLMSLSPFQRPSAPR